MLFPLQKLLEGHGNPRTITINDTLSHALEIMISNDYSQIPIVDEHEQFQGIITEQSIAQRSYHLGDGAFKLSYAVREFLVAAPTFSLDDDLFDILEPMKTSYAIVILDQESRVIGIVTDYDTGAFFRAYSEGMMRIQDIELSLRDYIETLLPAGPLRQQVVDRLKNNGYSIRHAEKLTFDNLIKIINEDWDTFAPYYSPRPMFLSFMERARDIRNDLAHFDGETNTVAMNALRHVVQWLETRPALPSVEQAQPVQVASQSIEHITIKNRRGNKYDALKEWLQEQVGSSISVTFDDIERIIGASLPPSARSTRNWWANDSVSRVQSIAWLKAGWRVIGVNLTEQRATFQRTQLGG